MTDAMRSAGKGIGDAEELRCFAADTLRVLQKLRVVIRAAQRHSQLVRRSSGVSGAQLWLLKEIAESPGLRVSELAARLGVHQSTVSNLLEKLELRGMVRRQRGELDHRVVLLFLSREGQRTVRNAPAPLRGILPEALMQMPRTELERLEHGLDVLLGHAHDVDPTFAHYPLPFTE